MSGPPWNFADFTARLTIRGDGRDDVLVIRPVTPQSFVAWSPPGALNQNSMMLRQRVILSGAQTLLTVSTNPAIGAIVLDAYAPWVPTYCAVVPPSGSTLPKNFKGFTGGDTGIKLIPNLPLILALPTVAAMVAQGWQLNYTTTGTEGADLYVW